MNVGVPAYEQITDIIRGEIISGAIPPNTRLTIIEVAKKFSVSQMPVREAFQCLQGEGLLKVVPHKGACVLALDPIRVRSFYLIRSVIEGLLARQSVHLMTDPILDRLGRINEQYQAAVEKNNIKKIMSLNKDFHKSMYQCGENAEAFGIYERYEGLLTALRHKHRFNKKRLKKMPAEHSKILKALSSKDGPHVENLIRMHIEKAMGDILSFLEE
jgi:DNA-binding GntR family transcriptional regulator